MKFLILSDSYVVCLKECFFFNKIVIKNVDLVPKHEFMQCFLDPIRFLVCLIWAGICQVYLSMAGLKLIKFSPIQL